MIKNLISSMAKTNINYGKNISNFALKIDFIKVGDIWIINGFGTIYKDSDLTKNLWMHLAAK